MRTLRHLHRQPGLPEATVNDFWQMVWQENTCALS